MLDAKAAIQKARAEVAEENLKKAVEALKVKYKARDAAKSVLANINREIEDLEASIGDGSFRG